MERPLPRTVQQPCSTTRSSHHGRSCQCYPIPLTRFYPPTADEISTAIRKVKKNRAPGICGITTELLKSGGGPVISWLLPLFTLIWKYCVIPTDWNLAIILPLWKGKGSNQTAPNTEVYHFCLFRPRFSPTYVSHV